MEGKHVDMCLLRRDRFTFSAMTAEKYTEITVSTTKHCLVALLTQSN